MNQKWTLCCLLSLVIATNAFAKDEMIVITDTAAKAAAVTAEYADLSVSFGMTADYDGNIYNAIAPSVKPVSASFKVDGRKVTLSFFDTYIILRIDTDTLIGGDSESTNLVSTTIATANMDVTEKFSIGVTAVRTLIRDSIGGTSFDWGQLTAAFTLVKEDGHKLAISVAPFMRTHVPFDETKASSNQFWLPVKVSYSYKYKKLSFSAAAQYIAVDNFTADNWLSYVVFGAGADYKLTNPGAKRDVSLYVDNQLWLAYDEGDLSVKDPIALTYAMAGMRVRF